MSATSKKLVDLSSHLIIGIVLATAIIQFVTFGIGADRVYWPRFLASLITAISILIVATIVLQAENSQSDNQVAISLFTFANSASALVPMVSEILGSNSKELSQDLQESVLFEIFSSAGWPTSVSFSLFLILVLLAIGWLWHAARKISLGQGVSWIASSSSVMILSLQTVLLSPWASSETINHPLLMLGFLILLIFSFSSVISSALRGVPTLARSSAELVAMTAIETISRVGWFLYAFGKRTFVLALYWLLPILVLWELLMPAGLTVIEIVYSAVISETFGAITSRFFSAVWSGIVYTSLALLCVAILGWLVALPERIQAAASVYGWFKSLVLRLLAIAVVFLVAAAVLFGLFQIVRSTIEYLFSPSEISDEERGPEGTSPTTTTPTKEEVAGPGEEAPVEPASPILRGFSHREVRLICESGSSGFGWRFASSDEISMSLSSCNIDPSNFDDTNGFFLILTSASTEAAINLDRENRLAFARGQTASNWLALKIAEQSSSIRLYALNLGMNLAGPVGVPEEFQVSSLSRPFLLYKFEADPADAVFESTEAFDEIADFLSSRKFLNNYALCDLYSAEDADVGLGSLTKAQDWRCPRDE